MDVVVPSDNGKLFGDKSAAELEDIMDKLAAGGEVEIETPEPEPPVEATPPVEPEPPAPVEVAPLEEAPPSTDEVDLVASETEGERIKREALEAKLQLQQAHSSRLAGEIGHLRKLLESAPRPSEPYEPQSQAETDRLAALEQRFAQSEDERLRSTASQAFNEAVARLDGDWSKELHAEVAEVIPRYADQIKLARETNDPVLARQMGEAIALTVKAEAREIAWQSRHKDLLEKKATTSAAALAAKKATAPGGSGGVSAPPPKPKSTADMTPSEADAWLRENVR